MSKVNGTVPQEEMEMREYEAPTPTTPAELADFVQALVDRPHDYGTCVYAMSLAATAAFNLVAHKLGVTGFQASCADLDIIRRVRRMKGPFMIVDGANLLYPQYDLHEKLEKFIQKTLTDWAPEQAQKLLTENGHAVGTVTDHWTRLVQHKSASPEGVQE